PDQVSTARDMATLARALMKQFPEHADRFTRTSMRFGKARLRSFNLLLKTFNGADGMKTGFVCAAGFNVVSSATRNGRRLIAVVLGAETARIRNTRAASLLAHGFEHGAWKTFFFPATLKTLPAAARAGGGPVNMRPRVRAWVCGWRKKKQQAATRASTGTPVRERRATVRRNASGTGLANVQATGEARARVPANGEASGSGWSAQTRPSAARAAAASAFASER
ncbi:MAG: D-alanyl-D-alanine carboxypeptidase, partial [Pseudomonadota bacterium]